MKKKNINKLALKKTAISRLDNLRGGMVAANAANANVASPTNVWSNCEECESLRNTQCKDKCPDFTKKPCENVVAVPVDTVVNNAGAI